MPLPDWFQSIWSSEIEILKVTTGKRCRILRFDEQIRPQNFYQTTTGGPKVMFFWLWNYIVHLCRRGNRNRCLVLHNVLTSYWPKTNKMSFFNFQFSVERISRLDKKKCAQLRMTLWKVTCKNDVAKPSRSENAGDFFVHRKNFFLQKSEKLPFVIFGPIWC